jgi:hypothetical protein
MVSDSFRMSQDVDHEGAAEGIRGTRQALDRGEVKSTWVGLSVREVLSFGSIKLL